MHKTLPAIDASLSDGKVSRSSTGLQTTVIGSCHKFHIERAPCIQISGNETKTFSVPEPMSISNCTDQWLLSGLGDCFTVPFHSIKLVKQNKNGFKKSCRWRLMTVDNRKAI